MPADEEESADPWPPGLPVDLREVSIEIARTRPARAHAPEVREAEKLTLDALRKARSYVCAEAQYLTSESVAECLVDVLSRRAGPDIVLVLLLRHDDFIQRLAMAEDRDRMLRRLVSADRHGRLGAFHPVVLDEDGEARSIDVHSKVIAADDRLLRVGSSNVNNRSMGFDTECDLAVEGTTTTRSPSVVGVSVA